MPEIKILTETELRTHVGLNDEAVKCVESAFAALAGGEVEMPPILSMNIAANNGEVDVKTAYVPGIDSFAVKISPGFFDNPSLGLPSLNGLMVLFSAKTGLLEALLLDNGYLTDVRTAAAGAVAANWLAREDSKRAAIFGAGMQARLQLHALCLVRPIEEAVIWARRKDQAEEAAGQLSEELGLHVTANLDGAGAVAEADIIVTTTPATEPILQADWLRPGQHITAMGSDNAHKNELSPDAVSKANLLVVDRQSQCERLGELHHAIGQGRIAAGTDLPEIGEVIVGAKRGRTSSDQLTICDLTGTGVQDTAIANLAKKKCDAAGAGAAFDS